MLLIGLMVSYASSPEVIYTQHMPRKTPDIKLISRGLYTPFHRAGEDLPRLIEATRSVPASLDSEFGCIIEVRGGRGLTLAFTIEHPSFVDEKGETVPTFEGEFFIDANEYRMFVGDTLWEPLADKVGRWTIRVFIEKQAVIEEWFDVVMEDEPPVFEG